MNSQLKKELEKSRIEDAKRYGEKFVYSGKKEDEEAVRIPSPSLMLDYKLRGGFPYKHLYEIYGPPSIGKSSGIAYGTIAHAQELDIGLVSLIAVEHRSAADREWMEKFGIVYDDLDIKYPNHAEDAFRMLKEVMNREHCFTVIDSIGALGVESEDTDELKKKAYGISGALTSTLNTIMPKLWKNNNALMLLNQQREKGRTQQGFPIYDSVGGQNIKHHASVRIQIKQGKNKIMGEKDGEQVKIGSELVCALSKNNLSETKDETANFDFIYKEDPDHKVGIDIYGDVINTAKMVGIVKKAGAWLQHDSFPDGKLQGEAAARKFLAEEPKSLEAIRKDVLALVR